MAQMAMVMNLDKCIGCHTCSVTCKQAWTNRAGTEYVWFNNVETRPGLGYPRTYEDQEQWQGGWVRKPNGRLVLRAGGRLKKLLTIFSNPKLPSINDYYEPWTYDYETLTNSPQTENFPVATPEVPDQRQADERRVVGQLGRRPRWLPASTPSRDVMLKGIEDKVKFEFEQTFMFYLPRICEHCLNPSCAASCPSGAIYKRSEDGIVLVDQDRCRGWRMCVSGCPYKKVYFNHKTGKAEKCTFCYPRVEVGHPDGVLRDVCGAVALHRARPVRRRQGARGGVGGGRPRPLRGAALGVPRPRRPGRAARSRGAQASPRTGSTPPQRSPVWALINQYEVALPLHPEYRTMPMVWYIPPLSPVVDVVKDTGHDAEDRGNLFAAIDALRIPIEYLANLFTAGDPAPVDGVLKRLAAMRSYMRDINLGRDPDESIPAAVGMDGEQMYEMFRLLALAKYDERYVIPAAHAEQAHALEELATECAVSDYGGGNPEIFGEGSGDLTPVAVENFRMLQERQTSDDPGGGTAKHGRVNLLNWDGKGAPEGLFPPGTRDEGGR